MTTLTKPKAESSKPANSEKPSLPAKRFKDEGSHRRRFWCKAPEGTTKEDPLYFEFWSRVAKQLVRHDIITVLADDESWELELCIEAVRHDGAEVTLRKHYSRKPIDSTSMTSLGDDGEFHTEWKPNLGWCVIRRADGHVMERGHSTEGVAILAWQRAQPKFAA